MNRVSATELLGERVVTSDDIELGTVPDFETGRITWVFVQVRRDVAHHFRIDPPFVTGSDAVALEPANFARVRPNVVLRISLAEAVTKAVVALDSH